ncbi:deoxyguanosinetriphosphate triphosphohydrolase family protein [Rhodococcoides fascians]|uniref:deoxyguanosinetriphosphate triphosphohydrolase family protein n=1 Tax=Rhodococcoides fascians TaxID=1828 RepID=UPI001F5B84B0|nr:dNTP triphosphohydrolase [Rhodococcus fascians]
MRTPTERDRGRVIYSSYLPRLAGVTQVVSPTLRHGSMHSRLTHSHKVATLSREIANDVVRIARANGGADRTSQPSDIIENITELDIQLAGGLDIAACELAGLAHDIGHAPFGHAAEKFLDKWLLELDENGDGFEGNAQTTRVLSKLDPHIILGKYGLNLTAVSMAAVQKYPWSRDHSQALRSNKFSVYADDITNLKFARSAVGQTVPDSAPSLEASIMDIADDITYAIHDLQDFYQAGLINIEQICDDLKRDSSELNINDDTQSYSGIFTSSAEDLARKYTNRFDQHTYAKALMRVRVWLKHSFSGPYDGSVLMNATVRQVFSEKIKDLLKGLRFSRDLNSNPFIHFGDDDWHEVQVLKQIAQGRVVSAPSVALHERSQLAALNVVLHSLEEWCSEGRAASLPQPLAAYVLDLDAPEKRTVPLRRVIVDFVCSLTDEGCAQLARNLGGVDVAWQNTGRQQ